MRADPAASLAARLSEAVGAPVELERPNDPAHGDYATNAALQLAPGRRRSPREVGEEIAAAARELDAVATAEAAGPGFVNLRLVDGWYVEALRAIGERGRDFGGGWSSSPERAQVEMVSANPTGPITVAAARNGAYGDAVARLLEFGGDAVER